MEHFPVSAQEFVTEKHCQVNDNYEIKEVLGEGSFGSVRKVTHKRTHEDRAIKILLKKKLNKPEHMKDILNEVSILRGLDHPNILKVYECYQDKFSYCIVTEMCTGGELFERVNRNQCLPEPIAADYITQILSCLVYINEKHIVHRDLKPENFLLSSSQQFANLKLIDFGSATHFITGGFMKEKIGTSYYIAPEVINGHYNEKCDIWSTGVMLYLMLSGLTPFTGRNDKEIMKNVEKAAIHLTGGVWDRISRDAKDIIAKMLQKDVNLRITAKSALNHPWLHTAINHPIDRNKSIQILDNLQSFHPQKSLEKVTLSLIASQLTTKGEREEMLELFKKLDTDQSGTLSKSEIKNGFSLFKMITDEELDRIMHEVDIDGSGEIDYSEFIVACLDKHELLTQERLAMAFNEYDTERIGSITRESLKQFLGGEHHYDDSIWNNMIAEADKNGDGVIDKEEFSEMMIG